MFLLAINCYECLVCSVLSWPVFSEELASLPYSPSFLHKRWIVRLSVEVRVWKRLCLILARCFGGKIVPWLLFPRSGSSLPARLVGCLRWGWRDPNLPTPVLFWPWNFNRQRFPGSIETSYWYYSSGCNLVKRKGNFRSGPKDWWKIVDFAPNFAPKPCFLLRPSPSRSAWLVDHSTWQNFLAATKHWKPSSSIWIASRSRKT